MSDLRVSVRVGAAVDSSFARGLQTAEQRTKSLGEAFERQNRQLRATGDVVRYGQRLRELRSSQQVLGRSSDELNRKVAEAERRYASAKADVKSYGLEVGRAADHHKRLTRELARTERGMRGGAPRRAAGGKLREMRGAALGVAGVAYGFSRAAGAAMAREDQANHLRTVITAQDGNRDAAVGRAVANARQVGRSRDSLATEQEVLEIEYALGSAGLEEQAARAGTRIVHRLAKVTRGAPEQVGEVFGVTFNNMAAGMEGTVEQKMGRIANVLAKTQFKFQIRDFGQLGESLKTAAPAAIAAGMSLEEASAAVGTLNSAGLMGSEAGTALQAVLRNLTKASDELGTSVVRGADGQLDLVATLEQIKAATDGMDIDERGDILQQIFGDEGRKGLIPLINSMEMLKAGHEELKEAAQGNLVNEEYERFLTSSSGRMQQLRRNVAQVGVTFAGVLLPAISSVVGPLASVASHVGAAIERYPVLASIVGGLATAVGAVAVGMAGYAAALWGGGVDTQPFAGQTLRGRAALGAWGLAMKVGAAATWLFNAALWANPLTWVGASVVAVAGLVWLYWEPLKAFFSGFWDGFTSALTPIGAALAGLAPIGRMVGSLFSWIGGAVSSLFGGTDQAAGGFEKMASAGQMAGKLIGTALRAVLFPLELLGKGIGMVGDALGFGSGAERPPGARPGSGAAAVAVGAAMAAGAAAAPSPEPAGATFAAAPSPEAAGASFAAVPDGGQVPTAITFPASLGAAPTVAARGAAITINGPLTGPITIQVPDGDPESIAQALDAQIGPALERLLDERMRRLAAEERLGEDDA
ncbi:MAG: phage tail tape measure protein [Gammaproteobacteria bacterium]|nr:phage tail tape measure protein [Gammaproteobacteria bacterium]